MDKKGQIMTLDFLIATILVIFSIGMLIGMAELRSYNIKEGIIYQDLKEKSEGALIIISSGSLAGCTTNNGTTIPFSFNKDKSFELNKSSLGLEDYNVSLTVDGFFLINDSMDNVQNIISTELELIECTDGISILETSSKNKVIANLGVGK